MKEHVGIKRIGQLIVLIIMLLLVFSVDELSAQRRSTYSTSDERDSHGKIKRSSSAKKQFEKQTGYPHGRPGYVVDHVVPLSSGGADSPSNMQWQTKQEAKAKDKWERGGSTSHAKVASSGKRSSSVHSTRTRSTRIRSSSTRSRGSQSHKSVDVRSYKTKKGTTVRSHSRSTPGTGSRRSSSRRR